MIDQCRPLVPIVHEQLRQRLYHGLVRHFLQLESDETLVADSGHKPKKAATDSEDCQSRLAVQMSPVK